MGGGLVGKITEYEMGNLNTEDTIALFQELVDTGLVWELQGSYQRTAERMAGAGLITVYHDAEDTTALQSGKE